MRGGNIKGPRFRASAPLRLQSEATAYQVTVPAPVGGWNTKDGITATNSKYAFVLDNLYPDARNVVLRDGKILWGDTSAPRTLTNAFVYTNGANSQLFVSDSNAIYDATSDSVTPVQMLNSGNGLISSTVNISNSAGSYIIVVWEGVAIELYDGDLSLQWRVLSAPGDPLETTFTVPTNPASDAVFVTLFKNRLWYLVQPGATYNNSLTAYYLPTDAIGGVAVGFPMAAIFERGGSLVAQDTWTVDGGAGSDDFLVSVTSEGELAVYSGTDPSSSTTWALVGVYFVGKPLGRKCFTKFGGDLFYLSDQGLFALSKLILSATIDRSEASLSPKIDNEVVNATTLYQNNYGWQTIFYPKENAILLNIPAVEYITTYQYVMNSTTKAWCRFTGWQLNAMTLFEGKLFGVSGSEIFLLWTGNTDDGEDISAIAQQSYQLLGQSGQKNISLVRPNFGLLGTLDATVSLSSDFAPAESTSTISLASSTTESLWGVGLWGTAIWGATPRVSRAWITIPSNPGDYFAFGISFSSSGVFEWNSTDFAVKPAGIL